VFRPFKMIGTQQVMHQKRRSGRIAKEVPILLLGTDTGGKVFAEQTKTVVLSRHGAGVVSKYRFAPDEVLTLRLPGTAKEAEVRLVGQIGGEPGRYVHGLTFVDPHLEFWNMDFPPPEEFAPAARAITLECRFCQAKQTIEHDQVEEDVYAVNGNVLRFCDGCGTSTPWQKTRGESASAQVQISSLRDGQATRVTSPVAPPSSRSSPPEAQMFREPAHFSPPTPPRAQTAGKLSAQVASAPAAAPSSYAATAIETLPAATFDFNLALGGSREVAQSDLAETQRTVPANADSSKRPSDTQGRPINRRRHMRVRVNYAVCVRGGQSGDDIAECENVSKGGLCFRSQKEYAVDSNIEIAAPYAPGSPVMFVAAKIRRVQRLGDGESFRYGVAYLDSKPAAPGF
jgi:PilZ domain